MSTRLPAITPRKMRRVVERAGFVFHHQRGSHAYFRHKDGRWTTIPMHPGDLPRGIVRRILKDIGLSEEEFRKLL
jgi:predicted RNA binding protein YcfA (HicA-like mRNA interferase family)